MQVELSIMFSAGIALLGVYATYHKISTENKRLQEIREKEILAEKEKQTERHIELRKSIEYVGVDVQSMTKKMDSMDTKFDSLDRRVTIVEESSKSAHKRIDGVEKKCELRNERRQ